jgi:hypothetical protein
MADHTDNGLRAAIKALDEVVAPAVDASNPLAVEQLRLVSRYLGFLRERLQYQSDRDRYELWHYTTLAQSLLALTQTQTQTTSQSRSQSQSQSQSQSAQVDQRLAHAVVAAVPLCEDANVPLATIRAAIGSLTAAISALVRSVGHVPPSLRTPIERLVLEASKRLLDVQRAFYLPIGFEPDPKLVPTMDSALAARFERPSR